MQKLPKLYYFLKNRNKVKQNNEKEKKLEFLLSNFKKREKTEKR